jgi:hypothetical protein
LAQQILGQLLSGGHDTAAAAAAAAADADFSASAVLGFSPQGCRGFSGGGGRHAFSPIPTVELRRSEYLVVTVGLAF